MPDYDIFFVHLKEADSAGEDGHFDRRSKRRMAAHSWHPVPVLRGRHGGADGLPKFDEVHCRHGSLVGRFDARHLMPQILTAAGRLTKFA